MEGNGWQIGHVYRPVEHLGGDFLDVQCRADGSWAVLIADVTGHGTTAALTAAMTKTAFLRAIGGARSAGQVLSEMNRELLLVTPPDQFVTAQVVVLDPHSAKATIASAGHPYAMLKRSAGVQMIETDNGMPLLVQDQAGYRDLALEDLHVDDSILLYTDGAIEATDHQQRQLGIAGLREIVDSLQNASPSLLEDLLSTVLKHVQGRLDDDVALSLIRRSNATS